jgi:hypothetical protein
MNRHSKPPDVTPLLEATSVGIDMNAHHVDDLPALARAEPVTARTAAW